MEADEVPKEDLDEEVIEPFVDLEDSQAQIGHIQCIDVIPCSEGTEEVALHEEKDGDWGGRIPPPDPGVCGPDTSRERHPRLPTVTFGRGSTQTTGEAPEGE